MYGILFLCLILSVSLLQLPGLRDLGIAAVTWCLVMIGILRGSRAALIAGIVIGLVQDISYGSFLGESALGYALAGYAAGYVRSLVVRDSLVLAVFLTGVCTELFDWVTYLTSRFFGADVILVHAAVQDSSRSALSTMILCVLLYFPFYRAFAKKPRIRYDDDSVEA